MHTLQGYYADPARRGVALDPTAFNGGGLPVDSSWDYRGNFSGWDLVGEGTFVMDDLVDANVDYLVNASYFQIPFDEFASVQLPPGDGLSDVIENSPAPNITVQSFYLTIKEVGALYQESLENWEVLNSQQQMLDCGLQIQVDNNLEYDSSTSHCINANQRDDLPLLQIGEGVASYPFYTTPYFYKPRKFMGRIYLESNEKCPTTSPTLVPTDMPFSNVTSSPLESIAPSISSTSITQSYIDAIPYGCHRYISTDGEYSNFANETSASYGIIFPIQTNELDQDGVWITSLGFHVDFNALVPHSDQDEGIIDYQVYTLINDGYYADPNRIRSDGTPVEYDYRGNFTYWRSVASGTISKSFLSFYSYNKQQVGDAETHFFAIPWDRFEPTYIPPNGGVQSFYLTLNSGSLVYRAVDPNQKNSIGKIQKDDNFEQSYDGPFHPPILLVGEGIVGYPFNTMPFLYNAKQFVGKVYYEIECPSESPSASPSTTPSMSESPSSIPSVGPTDIPSLIPSERPSTEPSTSVSPHTVTLDSSASISVSIKPGATISLVLIMLLCS